jgi:enoyl-CoA hydratase/carnithine racemase
MRPVGVVLEQELGLAPVGRVDCGAASAALRRNAWEEAMTIHAKIEGPILEVTIDRPTAMNALDAAANAELGRIWRRFNDDPVLGVAILTGAGDKAFSAGADLKTLIPAYRKGALGEAEVD